MASTTWLKEVRSGGSGQSSEEEIIKGFFHYLVRRGRVWLALMAVPSICPCSNIVLCAIVQAGWLYRSGELEMDSMLHDLLRLALRPS
jgi:hypothetical protein